MFLIGITYIVTSSVYILYTRETIRAYKTFIERYELRYLAILPAAAGLLFMISAEAIAYPWMFRIIAVIAFAETILAIINPNKIVNRMLNWFLEDVSDRTNRLFGIFGVILGTLFISWIKW